MKKIKIYINIFNIARFSEAANAYENCNASFKAVFAQPKKSAEEKSSHLEYRGQMEEEPYPRMSNKRGYPNFNNDIPVADGGYNKLYVTANPMLNQDQIWRLFDIVPCK